MVYFYLVHDDDQETHILRRRESFEFFYGWTTDYFTTIAYAYTIWMFEGSDYIINIVELDNLKEFIAYLRETGWINSEASSIDRLKILLFEQPNSYCQAMTVENWEEVEIDPLIIRDYIIECGVFRMFRIISIINKFMPSLTVEQDFLGRSFKRIFDMYLPDTATERDELISMYNMAWLMDILYGDEGIVSISSCSDIIDEFWEHCKISHIGRC